MSQLQYGVLAKTCWLTLRMLTFCFQNSLISFTTRKFQITIIWTLSGQWMHLKKFTMKLFLWWQKTKSSSGFRELFIYFFQNSFFSPTWFLYCYKCNASFCNVDFQNILASTNFPLVIFNWKKMLTIIFSLGNVSRNSWRTVISGRRNFSSNPPIQVSSQLQSDNEPWITSVAKRQSWGWLLMPLRHTWRLSRLFSIIFCR